MYVYELVLNSPDGTTALLECARRGIEPSVVGESPLLAEECEGHVHVYMELDDQLDEDMLHRWHRRGNLLGASCEAD